jgi:hypothetical protein
MSYHVGDGATITTTFLNQSGVATNPTTVSCTIKSPSGTITTPTPVNSATGVYDVDITFSEAGDWEYYIVGAGAAKAADQVTYSVEAKRIP